MTLVERQELLDSQYILIMRYTSGVRVRNYIHKINGIIKSMCEGALHKNRFANNLSIFHEISSEDYVIVNSCVDYIKAALDDIDRLCVTRIKETMTEKSKVDNLLFKMEEVDGQKFH